MPPRKKLKTGGPSGDDLATSVTPPPASDMPTTPPPTTLPSSTTTQSSGDESIADEFISLVEDFGRILLKHGEFNTCNYVNYIYNPVEYAKETHDCFVRKYGNSTKSVLFLGMNPGPKGTAQNGVPFGEPNYVKNWLKITGNVGRPLKEHPKRIIVGLDNTCSGVSDKRFWDLIQYLCGTPEIFFKKCFVYDYCPLMFLNNGGVNVTPESMDVKIKRPLTIICDIFLCKLIQLLEVEVVVAIGRFAEKRTKEALENGGVEGVRVVTIMHPSPINPATNKPDETWQQIVEKALIDHDLMKYMK